MPIARLVLWLYTLGGMGIMASSLFYEPPPLWFACLALFLYIALVSFGVVFSRFSMFADVVTLGPKNARGVALTFDDGPDPETTRKILDILDEAGARATFFVIGRKADEHPDLVREIHARGHGIGMHSYGHDRLMSLRSPWFVRDDLRRGRAALEKIIGEPVPLFRAPIGHISPSMGGAIRKLDLITIGWSVRAVDGVAGADADTVAQRASRALDDGAIVLLHDAAERGDFTPSSVAALPRILSAGAKRQLSFVRVDSWLGQGDGAAEEAAHDVA